MKRFWFCVWAVVLSGLSLPAMAASFRDGALAYNEGDYPTALQEFTTLADEGHVEAQFYLGTMFEQGLGVPLNLGSAATWYRKAADNGKSEAMLKLGEFHQTGEGAALDPVSAFGWFQRAASQGEPNAQYKLGLAYQDGVGVAAHEKTAKMWFERAAQGDVTDAQFTLGNLLFELSFPPKDNTEAYMWMSLAAGQGHKEARKRLNFFRIFMFSREITIGEEMALAWRAQFNARNAPEPKAEPQSASSPAPPRLPSGPAANPRGGPPKTQAPKRSNTQTIDLPF